MRKLLVINGSSQSSQSLPIDKYVSEGVINKNICGHSIRYDVSILKQCTCNDILCAVKENKPSVIIARSLGAYRLVKLLDDARYSSAKLNDRHIIFNSIFNELEYVLLIDPKKPFKFSEIETSLFIKRFRIISTYQEQKNPLKISGLRVKNICNFKQTNCDHKSINLTHKTLNLIDYVTSYGLP
jgi:hypothetical protein